MFYVEPSCTVLMERRGRSGHLERSDPFLERRLRVGAYEFADRLAVLEGNDSGEGGHLQEVRENNKVEGLVLEERQHVAQHVGGMQGEGTRT